MLQEDIFAALNSGVPDLGGRIYPVVSTESAETPYLIYSVAPSAQPATLADGPTKQYTRLQVDVYGRSYGEVQCLAAQVNEALLNASFESVLCRLKADFYEEVVKLHRSMREYSFWHDA